MGKKNTLLYLDRDLVRLAKRMKINISELTETAMKEKLLPILSSSEKILFDMDSYLEELKSMNSCFFLPFPVKKLELKNIGPIDFISMDFGPDINIINGGNGTGKSIIMRSIAMAFELFTPEGGNTLTHKRDKGYVKITACDQERLVEFDRDNPNGKKGVSCLLLDDAIARLPKDKIKPFINKLKNKYPGQIIMTTTRDDFSLPGAKVFRFKKKSCGKVRAVDVDL